MFWPVCYPDETNPNPNPIDDNQVGQGCTWVGHTSGNRRVLEDNMWDRVIQGRVLLLGDLNPHSPLWNPHCQRRVNAKPLEDVIEKFHLLINNESGRSTGPTRRGVSIIDLALSAVELGPLSLWEIPEDFPSLSDQELIVLRWEDMGYDLSSAENGTPTGWDISSFMNAPDKLEDAQKDWISRSLAQRILDQTSSLSDLDEEINWFEKPFFFFFLFPSLTRRTCQNFKSNFFFQAMVEQRSCRSSKSLGERKEKMGESNFRCSKA